MTAVDRIGRCEQLEADLISILHEAGEPISPELIAHSHREKVAGSGKYAQRCRLPRSLQEEILAAEPLLVSRFQYTTVSDE